MTASSRPALLALLAALACGGCSLRWSELDPPDHDGVGGIEPPRVAAEVPREGDLPIAPVHLRRQGGTVDYRAPGSRGLARTTFYEPQAEIGPGAYVLSYGASRAQLSFGEGSEVTLHNRCTALVEDATRTGSLLYLSALNRVTANLVGEARIRLPGGTLVGVAPASLLEQDPASASPATEGEATAPTEAPAEAVPAPGVGQDPAVQPSGSQDPVQPRDPLLDLLQGPVPGAGAVGNPLMQLFGLGAAGANGAGGATPPPPAPTVHFVATDFRQGRYVRIANRGNQTLLVATVAGEVLLAPGESADFPVLRGLGERELPEPGSELRSARAGRFEVRSDADLRVEPEGEGVRLDADAEAARVWAAGATFRLAPGETLRIRPLQGVPLSR